MKYYNSELGEVVASTTADANAVLFGARSYKRFEGQTNITVGRTAVAAV
jgi:hypothetical protein